MRRILLPFGMFTLLSLAVLLAWGRAADPPAKATTKPPEPAKSQEKPGESLVAKLYRRVDFAGYDDPKMTLSEILEDLSKKYGLPFIFNETSFRYENVMDVPKTPITAENQFPPMKNVRVDTILRQILARIPVPSGATFLMRRDRIEITTGIFFQGEVWFDNPEGPHLPVVQVLADKQPFEEFLQSLREQVSYNILLDLRAGEKAKKAITAELYNVPLDTALRLLAGMVDLQPVRVDNVLYITTPETAEAMEKAKPKKVPNNSSSSTIFSGPSGTLIRVPNE
jgi:hypothetical protein